MKWEHFVGALFGGIVMMLVGSCEGRKSEAESWDRLLRRQSQQCKAEMQSIAADLKLEDEQSRRGD